jgi:hypothetical protein
MVNQTLWHSFDPSNHEWFSVESLFFEHELDAQRSAIRLEHVRVCPLHRRWRKAAELMARTQGADTFQIPEHPRLISERVVNQRSHFEEQQELLHGEVGVACSEVEGAKRRPEVRVFVRHDPIVQKRVGFRLAREGNGKAQKRNDSKSPRHM